MLLNESIPIEEFEKKVDELTPEQLDAAIMGEEIEIKDEPAEKEPKGEAEEPEKDELEADPSQEDPKEEAPEKDEPKLVTIDDEYIKNADEKDRKILESIKGETLSDKLLKKHISAEHTTARFKGEKGEAISKLESLKREFETKQETTPVTPEKQTQIDTVVLNRLKAKYPDFPSTEEEMSDIAYENPRKAFEYMQAERDERSLVQKQVNEVEYYQQHAPDINTEVLDNDIALIKGEMEKLGITEEDLGVSFEFDENGDFKDDRLDKLLLDKNEFDPTVIDTRYGVPIIKQNAFATKFQRVFIGEIYKAIKNKALVEGAKGRKETESVARAMSNMKPGTQTQFENEDARFDKMTEAEIDAEIDKLF